MAIRDAKTLVEMGQNEFGFSMRIVDIGGGFPGETHSLWNPADLGFCFPNEPPNEPTETEEEDEEEEEDKERPYLFFTEIAECIAPILGKCSLFML